MEVDYIQMAINELEKELEKRNAISVTFVRTLYKGMQDRITKLEAAQQSVQTTGYQTAIIPCPHCGVNVTIDSDMLVASG